MITGTSMELWFDAVMLVCAWAMTFCVTMIVFAAYDEWRRRSPI